MKIRASSVPRLFLCPASAKEPEIKTDEKSEYADRGTNVHRALESFILNGKAPEVSSKEESELIASGMRLWDENKYVFRKSLLAESRHEAGVLSGTMDVIGFDDEAIVVGDWKTGQKKNVRPQIMAYIWLAREKYGPREYYTGAIFWLADESFESFQVYDEDLDAFYAKVQEELGKAESTYNPGEACAYCKRKLSCKARREYISGTATALAASGGSSAGFRLGDLWDRSRELKKALDNYEKTVKAEIDANGSIELPDGKRLTRRTYEKHVLNPEKSLSVLKRHGIDGSALYEVMNLSLPKAKKQAFSEDALIEDLNRAGALKTVSYQKLVKIRGEK